MSTDRLGRLAAVLPRAALPALRDLELTEAPPSIRHTMGFRRLRAAVEGPPPRNETIEAMCATCHGPIDVNPNRQLSATTCGDRCRGYFYHSILAGLPLAYRYQDLRIMHAHRRAMLATVARIEAAVIGGAR